MRLLIFNIKKYFRQRLIQLITFNSIGIGFGKNLTLNILLVSQFIFSQQTVLNYEILHNGNSVGWTQVEKNAVGNQSFIRLKSEVKTKLIFKISISFNETSMFRDGMLIYSSFESKVNGKDNSKVKLKKIEEVYELSENGKKTDFSIQKIESNLLCLFFQEPTPGQQIFCERQKRFVTVIKGNDGGFHLIFSDKNRNSYYYTNGICSKIKIERKFATIIIVPNQFNLKKLSHENFSNRSHRIYRTPFSLNLG